jgi:radical SAM protein with 4Fe4S-binding SPASM domain
LEKKSREHELTAVLGRDRFDACPGDISDPSDIERWSDYRKRYHEAASLKSFDFPLQIDFELNSTCNMRCGFCVHSYQKIKKKKLDFDTFKAVIDEGKQYGLCSIKLNYINEPLIIKDIAKYVRYAKENGVLNVYFATNGTLLSESIGRELIEAGLSKMMISLDATTPETFKRMRNSERYDEIVQNILSFIRLRDSMGVGYPMVRVNFLKTELNISESDEFINKWSGVADMIGFQDKVGLPGVDDDMLPDWGVSKSGSEDLLDRSEEFKCSFPFKMMVVDSNGDILPCCTFNGRDLPMGNINEMTIKQAWDSKKSVQLKEVHLGGNYRDVGPCVTCINGG